MMWDIPMVTTWSGHLIMPPKYSKYCNGDTLVWSPHQKPFLDDFIHFVMKIVALLFMI